MSGPQFVHMETYAMSVSKLRKSREAIRAEKKKVVDRKLSVEEICGEAARLDGHAPHVEVTKPPQLLFGVDPAELPVILKQRIDDANTAIKEVKAAMPRGTRRLGPKAIRKDTHCLMTMVASFPIPWFDPETGGSNFEDSENRDLLEHWKDLNLSWAGRQAEKLGFDLMSVVLHVDEKFPHLHFIGIPTNERVDARQCHPGYAAVSNEIEEKGTAVKRKLRDRIYVKAMRGFQDCYFEEVGIPAGLLRTGPKRRRLPGGVYKAEKAAAKSQGLANVHLQKVEQRTAGKSKELSETKALLTDIENDTADAIQFSAEMQRLTEAQSRELQAQQVQAENFERMLSYSGQLDEELVGAQDELDALRSKVSEEEAERQHALLTLAAEEAAMRHREEALAEAEKNLTQEKKNWSKWLKGREEELALREDKLERGQRDLASINEGLEAYASGVLDYEPSNSPTPFTLRNGSDPSLIERLRPLKARLEPLIRSMHDAMEKRAVASSDAIAAAIKGWVRGEVELNRNPADDDHSSLSVAETDEGKRLLDKIKPFQNIVTLVLEALPDGKLIGVVRGQLASLSNRLSKREKADAEEMEATLRAFEDRGTKGRD